jgi:4-diphosphocytidyl-2-C-methyl-D-erythritol kinase
MGADSTRRSTRGRFLTESVVAPGYAKINLTLEVLGKRTDGLHEVASVMQTLTLTDRLRFEPAAELTLRHRGLSPNAEDDLITRAARLLRDRAGVAHGCSIECTKRIPVAAGLGGGSADAGATLRALNDLWGIGLAKAELLALAATLGADVPFLVEGGTAIATGTGRDLAPLPDAPACWVVLVPISGDGQKTAEMYQALDPADFSDGMAARGQADAIAAGRIDFHAVRSAFTRAACSRWPATADALQQLLAARASAASVSGAGPSVFGLFARRADAIGALASVRAAGAVAGLHRFSKRAWLPTPDQTR